ncbi:MAG: metallophosphoesterase, partial [Clostridia bacterium]|nr:metallophosphoesterase [Clostridia bacterium]
EAYKTYYMDNTKVTWSGNWSAGQTDRYTGVYSPFESAWCFNLTHNWTEAFKETAWYCTKAVAESGLEEYLSSEKYCYIWGRDNFATTADTNFFTAQGSKGLQSYYTYSYIVPKDGDAIPSFSTQKTQVQEEACVMIMHNDTIVWPEGAVFSDPQTWETGHVEGTSLMASAYGLSLDCKAGDRIRFVVTGAQGGANKLDVLVTMSTVAPPSEELFELQASTSLAEAFAVNFIATYKNETAAAAATPTFTLAGNAVTPKITRTTNENGTVTYYYTIEDLTARKLTETIGYNISCVALDDSKTLSGTTTVADLLSYYLLEDGDLVDATEATSALAMASLNYAAAAQSYYNYNTTNLANAAIPEGQRLPSVKVKNRNLSGLVYDKKTGANLHLNEATLVLSDEVNIKFTIKADSDVDDLSTLKLRVTKTDGTFSDDMGSFRYVDETTDKKQIVCYAAVPMAYYAEPMTFAIYQGDKLVSDTLLYGVGTYAKRMYGKNTKLDNILDTMLALGEAADIYMDRTSNAVSANGKAIPANPGETIDLGQYNVNFNGKRLSLSQVNCKIGTSELNRIADGRYLLAPTEAGEYPLVLEYNGEYLIVLLSVCDENGDHAVPTLDKLELATIDLSGLGEKGKATSTWRDDLGYWEWALNLATYQAKKNDGGRNLPTALFLADMHWEMNNRNTAEVANYLGAELGIDKVFFAGDLLNGQETRADGLKVFNGWLEEMSTFDSYWYPVRGNHDNNGTKPLTDDEQLSDSELNDLVIKATDKGSGVYADRSKEGITVSRTVTADMGLVDKHGNALTKETNDCLFYYMDDANDKIRYYFLDDGSGGTFPKDYSAETGYVETDETDKMNVIPFKEQLKWMEYTATQGTDPLSKGWGIVVLTHRGLNPSKTVVTPTLYSLQAAETLTKIEQTIPGVDAFCILSAHTHYDGEHYNEDGGFYTIAISNDGDTRSATKHFLPELNMEVTHSGSMEMNTNNRLPGTDAEQLMDVVQIDRANRKVYLTRLGDGFSRTYDF